MEMLEQTGRLKVFRELEDWLSEFRLYHRDKGRLVAERDDLLAATRYALMMRREAIVKPSTRTIDPPTSLGWMG